MKIADIIGLIAALIAIFTFVIDFDANVEKTQKFLNKFVSSSESGPVLENNREKSIPENNDTSAPFPFFGIIVAIAGIGGTGKFLSWLFINISENFIYTFPTIEKNRYGVLGLIFLVFLFLFLISSAGWLLLCVIR